MQVLCCYYCNHTMLQASNISQRQYCSHSPVCVSGAWPIAASVSAVSLKFLHIIKGKDRLICTDLKQDHNTSFTNPSFYTRGGEEHFTPMGGREGGSYFMLQRFYCFYVDFFPLPYPYFYTPIHSVTEFIKLFCNIQTHCRSAKVLFIIRRVQMAAFSLCRSSNLTLKKIRLSISEIGAVQFPLLSFIFFI